MSVIQDKKHCNKVKFAPFFCRAEIPLNPILYGTLRARAQFALDRYLLVYKIIQISGIYSFFTFMNLLNVKSGCQMSMSVARF